MLQDKIYGTVIYDRDDPEERQNFYWKMSEINVPNNEIYQLSKLIHENRLLDIDKLTISRDDLRKLYIIKYDMLISKEVFNKTLDDLEKISIPMLDDNFVDEINYFFIHE